MASIAVLGYNINENMKKINIQRVYYHFRHKYLTTNNIVVVAGLVLAIGFVVSSLGAMDRNYFLQKKLEDKSRELVLAQLDKTSASLEQRYYKTDEYKELAVRQRLGLGYAGESVLILTDDLAKKDISQDDTIADKTIRPEQTSNFWQWVDFLSGKNIKNLGK